MELCFIKRKVSNIVFELVVSGYKKISAKLILYRKLWKVCGKGALGKEFCTWSELVMFRILFKFIYF